jgi:hypothetical protein
MCPASNFPPCIQSALMFSPNCTIPRPGGLMRVGSPLFSDRLFRFRQVFGRKRHRTAQESGFGFRAASPSSDCAEPGNPDATPLVERGVLAWMNSPHPDLGGPFWVVKCTLPHSALTSTSRRSKTRSQARLFIRPVTCPMQSRQNFGWLVLG